MSDYLSKSSALVLFSGGQDSTTCLAWALERFNFVETIGFFYGQRHAIELECRTPIREALVEQFPAWRDRLGPDRVVDLSVLNAVSKSALLNDLEMSQRPDGLPATFVPGRNILFLAFAGIVAEQRGLKILVAGTCETDFSGYPDCRDDTIKAMQVALNLGLQARLAIETPVMWVDKAQTWQLAENIGGAKLVDLIVKLSHTCYKGDRTNMHAWGFGCATCDACRLRAIGFAKYLGKGETVEV